jgi:CheY-like chemotaxis protein
VKSLVTAHGGRIEAESRGKGSTLTMTPPVAEAPAVASGAALAPARRGGARRRILVVDDNDDAALTLAESLHVYGHDTRVAHDGPTALEAAAAFRPEVVILDIGLPVMDGYELAERLRASGSIGPLRLIAVTGYGQDSDRERARRAGFDAHMAKPVTLEALLQLVDGQAADH